MNILVLTFIHELILFTGKIFSTTKKTLQSEPDTMLARMFSGGLDPGIQDEQGAYMLDRNPKFFEPILDYLRNRKLIIGPNVSIEGVLVEAQYFGIQNLIDQIEKTKEKDEKIQLTNIRAQLKDIAENIDTISLLQTGLVESKKMLSPIDPVDHYVERWQEIRNIVKLRKNLRKKILH